MDSQKINYPFVTATPFLPCCRSGTVDHRRLGSGTLGASFMTRCGSKSQVPVFASHEHLVVPLKCRLVRPCRCESSAMSRRRRWAAELNRHVPGLIRVPVVNRAKFQLWQGARDWEVGGAALEPKIFGIFTVNRNSSIQLTSHRYHAWRTETSQSLFTSRIILCVV